MVQTLQMCKRTALKVIIYNYISYNLSTDTDLADSRRGIELAIFWSQGKDCDRRAAFF
jgi:hypothetical protein